MSKRIEELFERHVDEDLKFKDIENKRSNRPDLHALMLLDSLFPGEQDIIGSAEHDEVFLSMDPEEIGDKLTEEIVIELIRCGVNYDPEQESFFFFT